MHRYCDQAISQTASQLSQAAVLIAEDQRQFRGQEVRFMQGNTAFSDVCGEDPESFGSQDSVAFLDGIMEGVMQPLVRAGAALVSEAARIKAPFTGKNKADPLDTKGVAAAHHGLGIVPVVDVLKYHRSLLTIGDNLGNAADSFGCMHRPILEQVSLVLLC